MEGNTVGAQQVHRRGAQQVQIRTGDSEFLPVALSVLGAWLGSGLYVPIGAVCLQIHLILILSLY